MALFKALVVRAYKHDAQIDLLEADVDVQHVFFGAAGDTDGRPRLTVGHGAQRHHKVEDHRDV